MPSLRSTSVPTEIAVMGTGANIMEYRSIDVVCIQCIYTVLCTHGCAYHIPSYEINFVLITLQDKTPAIANKSIFHCV